MFKYLSETLHLGIILNIDSEKNLVCCINSNYVRLINDHNSISSYIILLSGRLLSYQSKLQTIITLLLIKRKYIIIIKAEEETL